MQCALEGSGARQFVTSKAHGASYRAVHGGAPWRTTVCPRVISRLIRHRFQKRISPVLIKLDIEFGRHLVGKVEQLPAARHGQQQ